MGHKNRYGGDEWIHLAQQVYRILAKIIMNFLAIKKKSREFLDQLSARQGTF
jgi:hypothetical protein